jgi:hypothetical protein
MRGNFFPSIAMLGSTLSIIGEGTNVKYFCAVMYFEYPPSIDTFNVTEYAPSVAEVLAAALLCTNAGLTHAAVLLFIIVASTSTSPK